MMTRIQQGSSLEKGGHHSRIRRAVSCQAERFRPLRLAVASNAELVTVFLHPNIV